MRGSRHRDRAAQANAVPTPRLTELIESLATTAVANYVGNKDLAFERPQLDVYRLIVPQAVDQRDQIAVQNRMLACEQSSGVRGLLALEHPCTGADRGTSGPATPRGGSDLHLRVVADPLSFQAVSKVRTKARSPSTAMFTGVPMGVPSRLQVMSRTAHCPTKGSREGGAVVTHATSIFPCITRAPFSSLTGKNPMLAGSGFAP